MSTWNRNSHCMTEICRPKKYEYRVLMASALNPTFLFQIWLRFSQSSSGRNMGFMIFAQIFSLIGGGFVISKWQPRAKYICYFNIFSSAFFMSGILAMSFIDCKRSRWIEKGDKASPPSVKKLIYANP